jgi:hypothetical protein
MNDYYRIKLIFYRMGVFIAEATDQGGFEENNFNSRNQRVIQSAIMFVT